ncbi:MAG TPA: 2-oxoacid:acceptor oxidoreductase subunit alpha [Dehalococcoidia bacterium]|nr:2-oxoacid:acceptor oxidoreductase subunit alpha [Dehalococcoidia bacterium]
MDSHLNIMVAGEAGQGVQSVGFILAKAFARGGYHVFADQDYESRVRGGHNFFRVRVKEARVRAISEPLDILLALNEESLALRRGELATGGVAIFDGEKVGDISDSGRLFSVPLERLAEERAASKLMANTVALGSALGLVGYDFGIAEGLLCEHFGTGETGEANVRVARAGYDYVREHFEGDFDVHLGATNPSRRMLLTGNEAIALGAIAAGCKFVAAYPMTPATSIMEYLAAKAEEFGLVVMQPEDEIAAINMVIGASYAGVRAMTATSGGGFCLMVEGLGLAGMTETPIVVVEAQRPGPAIGLPTRTEQGDLEFILHAAHGEFPRAVLAPGTIEDCFWLTFQAFNLAERYQLPVILLTDHHLASSYATVDEFDLSGLAIDRGLLFEPNEAAGLEYKRHRITDSGISPRAFLGEEGVLVVTDSDEHGEDGHLIEDAETRTRMMQKRMRKLLGLQKEMAPPERDGPEGADTLLIGWGSTQGAILEAADILRGEGTSVSSLHLSELWPFPAEAVSRALGRARRSYVIENNATGQLANLIQRETGRNITGRILKYDGRPFTPARIAQEVRKEGG